MLTSRRSLMMGSASVGALLAGEALAAGLGTLPFSGAITGSFTPAWRSIQTSGGGAIIDIHTYPDGTVMAAGDTFGPWIRTATGSITAPDGTTYAAPAWQPLITSTSLPVGDRDFSTANSEISTAWAFAAAPNNTNVIYAFYGTGLSFLQTKLYYTSNRAVSWQAAGVTETFQPNGNFNPHDPMAVDPVNQDVAYLVMRSTGVMTTSSGSTGGPWSLISTSILPACTLILAGNGGNFGAAGCVIFDSSGGTTGGSPNKTKRILIGINGVGMYESTDAGVTWNLRNAGTAPTNFFGMSVDSFGQVWSTAGFLESASYAYKFASGTWTRTLLFNSGNNDAIVSVFQDPLYSGSVGTNQLIAITNNQGIAYGSLDNGATWTQQTSSPTLNAPAPQAAWLSTVNYYGSGGPSVGTPFFNASKAVPDLQTPGKIWAGLGIDMIETSGIFSGSTLKTQQNWSFDTTGVDQMVATQIIAVFNSKPILGLWDRAIFCIENPDSLQTQTQFPNVNYSGYAALSWQQILMAWSINFAFNSFTVVAVISWFGKELFAVSSDGGHTWTGASSNPAGMIEGSVCAASSVIGGVGANHFMCLANQGSLQWTHDGGVTWTISKVAGVNYTYPATNYAITSYNARRYPLTADCNNADTFYFIDQATNPVAYKSTDGGQNFTATGGTIPTTGSLAGVGADRLYSVPPLGGINTTGHLFYQPTTGKIVWSHDGGATWPFNSGSLDRVTAMGIGGLKPGGTYPALYALQSDGGTLPSGYYVSNDGGTTWSLINVPSSEQKFANHVMDLTAWLWGDWNVYGRIYVGYLGSTACYIDTADAPPYVNWAVATIKPNQSVTGTVSLTAEHSGAVPVTGVVFQVDGSTIASFSGSGPYTTSWNSGSVAHAGHTLSVIATGANGTARFDIPITTT